MQEHFNNLMMEINKCSVIVFSNRALDEIKKETYRKSPVETGGILLGKIIDDQWYVIATTEPGPNSIFQISYFEYDQEFVTKEANRISKEYVHELELLGLWHRHPGSMDTFSRTDDGTNIEFARLNSKGAISGLVNLDPDFRLTMYHVDNPLNYNQVEIFTDDELIPPDLLILKSTKNEQKPADVIENKGGIELKADLINSNLDEVKAKKKIIRDKRHIKIKLSDNLKESFRKNLFLLFLGVSCFFIGIIVMYFYSKMIEIGYHYTSVLRILFNIFGIFVIMLLLFKLIRIKRSLFWYKNKNSNLETEKALVAFNFPEFKIDTNEEDGRLFWHGEIISSQGTKYNIQIVYDNDFKGQSNKIHTYFIEPDLLELQSELNVKLPFLFKDSSNLPQLQFKTKGNKSTALYYIRQSIKWINNFESWSKKDITLKEFKNLKID